MPFVLLQLDGMIVAPTDSESWGRGLMWWIEFTKLKGITIQGNGVIDGRGTGWWQQDNPFDYPIDDDFKLIVPLNNTVQERPPMPVKHPHHTCLHSSHSYKNHLTHNSVFVLTSHGR